MSNKTSSPEKSKKSESTTTTTTTKRKMEFFKEVDTEYEDPHSDHPLASKKYFSEHPPIPIWNVILDNKTLEIIETRTGLP